MKNIFSSLFFLLSFLFLVNHVTPAAITCDTVESKAIPCVTFAAGMDVMRSASCCSGLEQLAQSAQSVDEKKAVCRCLKDSVKNFNGVRDKFLSKIPDSCKIKVGFPISLSIDCDTIQ